MSLKVVHTYIKLIPIFVGQTITWERFTSFIHHFFFEFSYNCIIEDSYAIIRKENLAERQFFMYCGQFAKQGNVCRIRKYSSSYIYIYLIFITSIWIKMDRENVLMHKTSDFWTYIKFKKKNRYFQDKVGIKKKST